MDDVVFNAAIESLAADKEISLKGDAIARRGLKDELAPEKAEMATNVLRFMADSKAPVLLTDIILNHPGTKDIVYYLRNHGEIIELPDNFFADKKLFEEIKEFLSATIKKNGLITIQDLAAGYGFSRRINVSILTKFDQLGITVRQGNQRVPGRRFGKD